MQSLYVEADPDVKISYFPPDLLELLDNSIEILLSPLTCSCPRVLGISMIFQSRKTVRAGGAIGPEIPCLLYMHG